MKKHLKLIQAALFILIGSGIVWLLRDVDLEKTVPVIRGMDFGLLAVVFVLSAGNIFLYALRWNVLLRATSHGIAFKNVLIATISAIAINTSGPGKLGVPAKAFLMKKLEGLEVSRTLPSIMIELFLEIVSLFILMVAFALLLGMHDMVFGMLGNALSLQNSLILLAGAAVVATALYPLRNTIRNIAFLAKLFNALRLTLQHKTIFVLAFALSLANLLFSFWGDYLLFRALHQDIPYSFIAFSSAFSTIAGIFSPMPGGLGVWELSRAYLFKAYYNIGEIAVVMTLIRRLLTYFALGIIHVLNATVWSRYTGEVAAPKTEDAPPLQQAEGA